MQDEQAGMKRIGIGEPILWVDTQTTAAVGWRGSNVRRNRDGLQERKPATPHLQEQDDGGNPVPHPFGSGRYVDMLRHDGNVVSVVMTNAAAHIDLDSPYARYQRAHARQMGWMPFNGYCPVRGLKNGEVLKTAIVKESAEDPGTERRLILDETLLGPAAHVCPKDLNPSKPCPHMLSEQTARRKANEAEQDKINALIKVPELRQRMEIAGAAASGIGDAIATALPKAIEMAANAAVTAALASVAKTDGKKVK